MGIIVFISFSINNEMFKTSIENIEAYEDFYRCNRSNTCYGGVYQGEYTVTEVTNNI